VDVRRLYNYDTILYKGLEHLCILVFMGILESVSCVLVPGTVVCRMYAFPEYFIDSEYSCYNIESISPLCILFTSITGMSQFFFSKYFRNYTIFYVLNLDHLLFLNFIDLEF